MAFYHVDKNLKLKRTFNYRRFFAIALVLIMIQMVALVFAVNNVKVEIEKHHTTDTIYIHDIPLNDTAVTKELIKLGCILPNVALAQAKIESGHYKSPVCKQNKNMFGIKSHKCAYVTGENLNHATYKSYRDNIKCYIEIQNRYLNKIDGRYAEAPGYIKNLKIVK